MLVMHTVAQALLNTSALNLLYNYQHIHPIFSKVAPEKLTTEKGYWNKKCVNKDVYSGIKLGDFFLFWVIK